ncbi:MAG: VOC family protein [Candidatus Kerfeldbacteria bacterium]|nr:VOC family protein [Candidatus Kerfeldbacteria bacterium]
MKASAYHLQLNTSDLKFYRKLCKFLQFKTIDSGRTWFGVNAGTIDLWIFQIDKKFRGQRYRRRGKGLHHLALRVSSAKQVDAFLQKFVLKHKLSYLYGGPKRFPQYSKNYYALYFEDPDKIVVEIVYR